MIEKNPAHPVHSRRLTVLAVAGDPDDRRSLDAALRAEAELDVRAACAHGSAALRAARLEPVDLLVTDARLPDMSGFELLERWARLRARPDAVFVTRAAADAARALDAGALDCLVRPFAASRLRRALERARLVARGRATGVATLRAPAADAAPSREERLAVRSGGAVTFLGLEEVVWLESADHYVLVHTAETTHVVRESMARLERRLDPSVFLRVHRCAMVNRAYLGELRPARGQESEVVLTTGRTLPVSRRRMRRLREQLGL